jgi:protein-S-isoprenylcysteine O-methyltransferase Ste14
LRAAGWGEPVERWVGRTPNRTFVLYPLLVVVEQAVLRRGRLHVDVRFAPLLAWGYLQYRLVGRYRVERGGGGPGITIPPERLVEAGPYRHTRNPMYLGHLIFLLGLTLAFRSRLGAALLVVNAGWFHRRVVDDEARLARQFGPAYEDYRARVRRWIPGLF